MEINSWRKVEMEKRKRPENKEADGRRTRAKEGKGEQTATEDEVEEFFAIIRRIRDTVQYFEKRKGEESKIGEKGGRWRPAFEKEDFEEANSVKVREKKDAGVVASKLSLDLNADPESGKISV